MSRIGKKVIVMPAGVTAKFENDVLTVSGPKRHFESRNQQNNCSEN